MAESRDPLLEALLSGEISPDAPEVRERLERDAEFAESLADFREVQETLRSAAAFRGELAREVEAAPATGHEDRVRRTVLKATARRRRPWILRLASVAAAAAAVVVVFLSWPDQGGSEPGLDPNSTLGTEFGLLQPLGEVPDFACFEWSADLRGILFTVIISDANGREIDREENLMSRSWSPAEERRRAWPDRIRWRLEASTAVGSAPRVSPSVPASRSR